MGKNGQGHLNLVGVGGPTSENQRSFEHQRREPRAQVQNPLGDHKGAGNT